MAAENKSERVLVTGAAGFIGSHVAEQCGKLGMQVVAVDDLSGGVRENVPAGATFVRGDVTSPETVEQIFREHGPFSRVYHLAAYAAEGLSHFIRRFNYRTNLIASVNLLNASVNTGVKTFVFTSSIAVYGRGQLPMHEDLVPRPEDPYGISKYAFELDLLAAHEMFGIDFVVFRPHNVYGERQNIADKYRNVVGIFMNQVLKGEPMTVFGDGLQSRAFSHIDDVAPIIARSVHVEGARNQVFNVGADTPCTVLDLAQAVAKAFGREPQLRHLAARNEVVHAYADHSKVARVFQPAPAVSLVDGIARMAKWVEAHGPSQPVEFGEIEVEKGLPPSWRKSS